MHSAHRLFVRQITQPFDRNTTAEDVLLYIFCHLTTHPEMPTCLCQRGHRVFGFRAPYNAPKWPITGFPSCKVGDGAGTGKSSLSQPLGSTKPLEGLERPAPVRPQAR